MSENAASSSIVSRRGFVAATALSSRSVLGANDRVRLGVIGNGGRGRHLIRMAQRAGGCEFVALSDAWATRMTEAQADIVKGGGGVFPRDRGVCASIDQSPGLNNRWAQIVPIARKCKTCAPYERKGLMRVGLHPHGA